MRIEARRAALRHGLGAGGTLAVAVLVGWPLGFLAAVFAGLFLSSPAAMPPRVALALVVEATALMVGVWLGFTLLAPYPVVSLLLLCVAVIWGLGRAVRGAGLLNIVFTLLAVLLTPFLIGVSRDLAWAVVIWLPLNLILGLVVSWLGFAMWPADPAEAGASTVLPAFDANRRWLRMSLVTVPFVIVFFVMGWTSALTVIFVAILCALLAGSPEAAPIMAQQMMRANLLGGAMTLVIYEVLVIAPFAPLMVLLLILGPLALAALGQSARPEAALAGSAITALVILLGGSLAPFGAEADVKLLSRLWQVGAALAYILVAFVLVDRWVPEMPEPALDGYKSN